MKKALTSLAVAAIGVMTAGTASAYVTTFAEDVQNSATSPLTALPKTTAAEVVFLAGLTGERVENFEGLAACSGPPASCTPTAVTLGFTGSDGAVLKATLAGGGGFVRSVPSGTSESGRYSVPSGSSTNFWRAAASPTSADPFEIHFDSDIAAFGFYGVDIGDFGGRVTLELLDSSGALIRSLEVPNTDGTIDLDGDGIPDTPSDGSVLYYGLRAQSISEVFRSIRFRTSATSTDVFAFDNFTIADKCQAGLCGGGGAPEPGSLALAGLALLGLGVFHRRRV